MMLTLVDRSIMYPYRVLEDVFIRVDGLLFLEDFVILYIYRDFDIPLLLGRPFLSTGKALIDVELGELILRFNKEKIVFNMFEVVKHQKENHKCYMRDLMK